MFRKSQLTNSLVIGLFVFNGTLALGSELLFIKDDGNGMFSELILTKSAHQKTLVRSQKPLLDRKTPLGSLWKLFTYAYLLDSNQTIPDYQCTGNSVEEKFCCEKGGRIDMDKALIKSCGLFFSQSRVQIDSLKWNEYWGKLQGHNRWLLDYKNLNADTEVPLIDLLMSLKQMRVVIQDKERLENTLSRITISGTGKQGLKSLGTALKFKTFSWKKNGGMAGWGPDGKVFFVSSTGKSSEVLKEWSEEISGLTGVGNKNKSNFKVKVKFFERYPIKDITNVKQSLPAQVGVLDGEYEVAFENGNRIRFFSQKEIRLHNVASKNYLSGEFSVDEYVARVIDREISADPEEAAKAFSILIRTYLINNSQKSFNKYEISDSSRYQRVSISRPSKKALKIAEWGHDLILKNTPDLTYHSSEEGKHKLSWAKANMLAQGGSDFLEILKTHYKLDNLALVNDSDDQCLRINVLEDWINKNKKKWKKVLFEIKGFSMPDDVKVCQSNNGKQYSDLEKNRIFLNYQNQTEDLITAAHEFLHIAYKNHSRTNNEDEIEQLAKRIILGTEEKI